MSSIKGIQKISRNRDAAEDHLLAPLRVLALLQGADGDAAAREVDARRRDLQQLGRAAPGPVQGLAKRTVPGRLQPGRAEEGGPFLGVEIETVSGGIMKAHFGHVEQNA